MTETEGVIKYALEFEKRPLAQSPLMAELNTWRTALAQHGLIGADPHRYGGLGFGNLSARIAGEKFLITGSQTGFFKSLGAEHFAEVEKVDLATSLVCATGSIEPSSEALTHAAIYAADPTIDYVFHVHSPDIWSAADRLGLAVTSKSAPYGTPEMALEMRRAISTTEAKAKGLIVMLGHEDGVVSFGKSATEAGSRLTKTLTSILSAR